VCSREAKELLVAEHSSFVPLGPVVHVTHSEFQGIPLCGQHARTFKRRKLLAKTTMVLCYFVFLPLSCLAAEKSAQTWPYYAGFLFFALALLAGFSERWLMPVRIKEAYANPANPKRLARLVLSCSNESYARRLIAANGNLAAILAPSTKGTGWMGLYCWLAPALMIVLVGRMGSQEARETARNLVVLPVMFSACILGIWVRWRCAGNPEMPGRIGALVGILVGGGFTLSRTLKLLSA